MARAEDLLAEREQGQDGFAPHRFGGDGQEWLAVSFTGDETVEEQQQWPDDNAAAEDLLAEDEKEEQEEEAGDLLPDSELISAGRPVPEELLTIRPEYSDDLSKITNKKLYEAYIQFLTDGWPGWTAPRRARKGSAAVGDLTTDLPDPRRDPSADNAEWQRLEETSSWLESIVPQSRLDSYPLYVLCRELLRKVTLREIEYHDARNVALSDLVGELRRAVAAAEAAVAKQQEDSAARLAAAEARRNAEADRADAERERLEAALGAAMQQGSDLRAQVRLAPCPLLLAPCSLLLAALEQST